MELTSEAHTAGAGLVRDFSEIDICLRTLKRWRKVLIGDGGGHDRRKGSPHLVTHKLSEEERQRILLTCNQAEYASLPPGQIVPALADQGLYVGSESRFYRVLHAHGQAHRCGRTRPPQEPSAVPRLRAAGANQLWSWDITYSPTTVRAAWLYLYLVIDVWSRKVLAWDVVEREDHVIAVDLASSEVDWFETHCESEHRTHGPSLFIHRLTRLMFHVYVRCSPAIHNASTFFRSKLIHLQVKPAHFRPVVVNVGMAAYVEHQHFTTAAPSFYMQAVSRL
jgi:hypothetical protein